MSDRLIDAIEHEMSRAAEELNSEFAFEYPDFARAIQIKALRMHYENVQKILGGDYDVDLTAFLFISVSSLDDVFPNEAREYAEALVFAADLIDEQVDSWYETLDGGVPIEDLFASRY